MTAAREDDHLVEPLYAGLEVGGERSAAPDRAAERAELHRQLREDPRAQGWITLLLCGGVFVGFLVFFFLLR